MASSPPARERESIQLSRMLGLGESARRPKRCVLACNRALQRIVASKLAKDWSPQQIAGWLKDQYPDKAEMWVSHETIYQSLFVQACGANLVEGSRGTFIATLVERQSRFVILVKIPDKRSVAVVAALIKAVRKLPVALRRSLTWDRGVELSQHVQFTIATDVQVYFCDPSSPWQRGSNENTNGLLRQYYPKGTDLSAVSQAQLDLVATKLNTRLRQTLHWKTPAYILQSGVSPTT
jgi:IS30 family transposase